MCGIAGALHLHADRGSQQLALEATRMAEAIRHRGPDSSGTWVDERAGIGLGHRRLSIIDLSEDGAQPMTSADGRWVLVYNGELYNFRGLRHDLEQAGCRFRGSSDTEVLVEAVAAWGLDTTLERSNGMFAFAVWDRQRRELHLARDRIGEKPLYYGWFGDTLLFGSELRALEAHPAFVADIDRDAVGQLLKLKYIPAPLSIYREVRKLEPATVATISAATGPGRADLRPYWSALEVVLDGLEHPTTLGFDDIIDELDARLREAVSCRMIADVPLGAFLSGGIDSSTVVALMQQVADRPVRTFTIGVESADYDEAEHAKRVAAHLGTDHTELYVTPGQVQEVIPRLPEIYDEPFADSSQIPVFLVSQLARQDVTVALSGDGGDELFAGYNRHVFGPKAWRLVDSMPATLRRGAGAVLTGVAPDTWDRIADAAGRISRQLRHRLPGEKLHKLGRALPAEDMADLYDRLRAHWYRPQDVVAGAADAPPSIPPQLQAQGFAQAAMYLDLVDYLPGDILTKVDRAAMAVSLETRIPLLDPAVIEFAWSIPHELRLEESQGKAPLRRVLSRYVPHEMFDRPKSGFGVPVGEWLRGPLRAWGEDVLFSGDLDELVSGEHVRRVWERHQRGEANLQYQLWDVLMLQAWRGR